MSGDALFADAAHLLANSEAVFVKRLFDGSDDNQDDDEEEEDEGPGGGGGTLAGGNRGKRLMSVTEEPGGDDGSDDEEAQAAARARALAKRRGGGAGAAAAAEPNPKPSAPVVAAAPLAGVGASVAAEAKVSLCMQMMSGVEELLGLLEKGDPLYVRCIKSNGKRSPLSVDAELVKRQVLRTTSLLDARALAVLRQHLKVFCSSHPRTTPHKPYHHTTFCSQPNHTDPTNQPTNHRTSDTRCATSGSARTCSCGAWASASRSDWKTSWPVTA